MPKTKFLPQKIFSKINLQIENIFDQPASVITHFDQGFVEAQNNFQTLSNNKMLENLSYIFSSEITHDNLPSLFAQLAPCFEIGFLLQKSVESQTYQVKDAFSFSQKILAPENLKPIKLPPQNIYKILKTRAHPILDHFRMKSIDTHDNSIEKMVGYLLPITSNYTILLITKTAEPWASLKMECLKNTLMKIDFSI